MTTLLGIWLIGWMFMVGWLIAYEDNNGKGLDLFTLICVSLVNVFLWPLFLGNSIGIVYQNIVKKLYESK